MPRCLALIGAMFLAGCTIDPHTGKPQASKAVLGIGSGEAIADKPGTGATMNAGTGVVARMGVGAYLDRQEAILRQTLATSGVQLIREGQSLRLIMPDNLTFAVGSSDITPKFYSTLKAIAIVLNEFPETLIEVTGHTDAVGTPEYNQRLSEKRAHSVAQYLAAQGVAPYRLLDRGMGQSKPIAPNDTPAGRALNRRVEIRIHPMAQ